MQNATTGVFSKSLLKTRMEFSIIQHYFKCLKQYGRNKESQFKQNNN